MPYNHGVRVQENPTALTAPIEATAGLQVIVGVAPVNLAEDPYSATNTPLLAYSFAEASAAVGYCDDFANYNMCESIDASFRVLNVAPIVLINVLDPKTHRKALEETTVAVEDGVATIDTFGILADTLTVSSENGELTADTDYVVTFDDDGYAVITLVEPEGISELTVSGYVIDPSQITTSDIIGGYNVSTGEEKGLEVIRQVFPKLQLVPGQIVCPKYSADPNVSAAISAKLTGINGIFSCTSWADIDSSADGCTKYTDVNDQKSKQGLVSEYTAAVWPCAKVGDKIYHGSAIMAALTAYTDANNDDVPYVSPSNESVPITGICLEDGTEVILDEEQANTINSYGVCTFNNFSGWTSWGNNTVAYPSTTDPKDRWLCCRRFFCWWEDSFMLTYHQKVDNPANYRLIESIVDSENIKGNAYVAQGKVAGVYMEYRESDNPVTDVMNGKMQFYTHLAPFTPAEDILNVLEFDPDLLEAAFTGGAA